MGKRENLKKAVHISNILNDFVKNCRTDIDEELMGIWSLWDKAVGNVIAENTRPYAVKGKLLMVNVISSTWMHHLQFLKKDMTNAINGSIGKTVIEDIIFKIGPI